MSSARGRYIGKHIHVTEYGVKYKFEGYTALLYEDLDNPDNYVAQFDDLALPREYTHAWVSFPKTDFVLIRYPGPEGLSKCPATNILPRSH